MKVCKLLFCLMFPFTVFGQLTLPEIPTWIDSSKNAFINDSLLHPFFDQLIALQQGKPNKVNITHIGDSHIQADLISGTIRQNLQLVFGNGGRGFVFPYKAAGSNEPYGYRSKPSGEWKGARFVTNNMFDFGMSGFVLNTSDGNASLTIQAFDYESLNYRFTNGLIFYKSNAGMYIENLKGDLLDIILPNEEPTIKPFDFDTLCGGFNLKIKKPENEATDVSLYGFQLLNDNPGLVYNMLGVNGAEFRHYANSKFFEAQFKPLQSDLVILSLGTNDVYTSNFNEETVSAYIDTLVAKIRRVNPKAVILLSSPGDHYRLKHPNPNLPQLATLLHQKCIQNGLVYWDYFHLMGGSGSSKHLLAKGLYSSDKIHLSRAGYLLKGNLFTSAVLTSYLRYSHEKY